MSAAERLIAAMRTCGCDAKIASEWLTAAQRNDALAGAFKPVFGSKLPHPIKFGRWLKQHSEKTYGELRLSAVFSTHRKGYLYAVETPAEIEAREHREEYEAERREIIEAEKEQRAVARALRKHAEAEAAARAKAEAEAPGPTLTVTVMPAPTPPRVKCGPDGRPVPAEPDLPTPPPVAETPKPETAPAVAESRFAPWVGVNGSGTPVLTRQPTRAELAARHRQHQGAATTEHGSQEWFVRACEARNRNCT